MDAQGNDAADAEVTAWSGASFPGERRRQVPTVRTDARGRARIERPAAAFTVEAVHADTRSGERWMTTQHRSLLVALRDAVTIRGRVVDAAGRSVRGATVSATNLPQREKRTLDGVMVMTQIFPTLPAPPTASTDAEGRFALRLHRGGLYALRELSTQTSPPIALVADDAAAGTEVVLRLCERVRVSGLVVDGVGATVPHAQVRVRAGACEEFTRSRIDGTFAVDILADGAIDAAATADLHALALDRGVSIARAPGEVDVHVRLPIVRVVTLRGSVRDQQGTPVPGLHVEVHPVDWGEGRMGPRWSTKTTAAGLFELPRLLAGAEYDVFCVGPGATDAPRRIMAGEGIDVPIVLAAAMREPPMRRSVRVRAMDHDSGAPVTLFDVTPVTVTAFSESRPAGREPGPDGVAEFEVIGSGDLYLEVAAAGYVSFVAGSFPPGAIDIVADLTRPVPVRVLVCNAEGRAMPAKVAAERRTPLRHRTPMSGVVDADGGCDLLLAPGTWQLRVTADLDGATVTRTVEVVGAAILRIDLR